MVSSAAKVKLPSTCTPHPQMVAKVELLPSEQNSLLETAAPLPACLETSQEELQSYSVLLGGLKVGDGIDQVPICSMPGLNCTHVRAGHLPHPVHQELKLGVPGREE